LSVPFTRLIVWFAVLAMLLVLIAWAGALVAFVYWLVSLVS
jgi:hypothetical protein